MQQKGLTRDILNDVTITALSPLPESPESPVTRFCADPKMSQSSHKPI